MSKRPPERLAAALRANLKRRKASSAPEGPPDAEQTVSAPVSGTPGKAPPNPVEKAATPPFTKG